MASRSETVLVTGARGFTGRVLCGRLRQVGYRVIGLVESDPATDEIRGDLLDAGSIASAVREAAPDLVIHLAAISSVEHGRARELYCTNVLGSLALLDALATQGRGLGGVVLASTARVYGDRETGALDESASPAPASHYAASKLAMELMAAQFRGTLPLTVVRPFNYTGPGQPEPFVVPKIVRHFAQRRPEIELGNVDVVRDFLDVRTVVEAYCRLVECPAARGQVINICSEVGVCVREIVTQLERLTGHTMRIRVNPELVRANEPRRMVGSASKLRSLVGELPAIPLSRTLADMLRATLAGA